MESELPSPGGVKDCDDEKSKKTRHRIGEFPDGIEPEPSDERRVNSFEIEDRRTFEIFLRFQGLLRGVWAKSRHAIPYFDCRMEYLHRALHDGRHKPDYSLSTIQRQFPKFARWSDEFRFIKTRVTVTDLAPGSPAKSQRRSVWVVRVTLREGIAIAVPGASVRERLTAAIRAHVRKSGRCHCDREFVRRFANLAGLPRSGVEAIWLRIEKHDLRDLTMRWKGDGRGRKLVVENSERLAAVERERAAIYAATGENLRAGMPLEQARRVARENLQSSDPQTSGPVSISFGNERFKTSGLAPGCPEESAPSATANETARGDSTRETRPEPEPGGHEHDGNTPADGRANTAFSPLQICNRFVSARKLLNLATWLAGGRLKFAHVKRERVAWLFPHARNFAYRALRFGYRADVIERAYVAGVERSHNDALAADRIGTDDAGFPVFASQRRPSAAVVYAWHVLRAGDPREPVELWAEFFAGGRRERDGSRPAAKLPAVETARVSASAAPGLLAELRAIVAKRDRPGREKPGGDETPNVTLAELSRYLAAKHDGLTLAKFAALPWRVRESFIARAAAWKSSAENER